MLRDLGIANVAGTDGRLLEVVATGLSLARGLPLGVDCTMVSALHCDGMPWARAESESGASIKRAEATKKDKYPELVASDVAHLLTLACEVGGRWSLACSDTLSQLAAARARSCPVFLRASARAGFEARWWSLLSCAQQDSLAASLVDDGVVLLDGVDAPLPFAADVALDTDA